MSIGYDKSHRRWSISYRRCQFDEKLLFKILKEMGIETHVIRVRLTNSTIELVLDVYCDNNEFQQLETQLRQIKNIS